MVVNFTKMHGLGNDFMVVDMISHHVHLRPRTNSAHGRSEFWSGF